MKNKKIKKKKRRRRRERGEKVGGYFQVWLEGSKALSS
jgi:hypothetical protein